MPVSMRGETFSPIGEVGVEQLEQNAGQIFRALQPQ